MVQGQREAETKTAFCAPPLHRLKDDVTSQSQHGLMMLKVQRKMGLQ